MLISIIVPIYNTEKYLSYCLDSIIRQTYKNIEIILVDDGSTDKSLEICKGYAKLDTRIKIEHKTHQGLVMTRKWGVEKSKGKYCIFVDSDDWIDENLLESIVPVIEDNSIDIVNYTMKSIESNTICEWKNTIPEGTYEQENLDFIWKRMMFDFDYESPGLIQSLCTKLMKKELLMRSFEDIDSRITMGEDASVTFKAMLLARKIVVMNDSFYFYRVHSDSMCRTKDIDYFSKIYFFKEYMKKIYAEYHPKYKLYKQLNAYMMHFILKGLDDLFSLKLQELNRIPDCLCTDIKGRIVLYGAGNVGKQYYKQLQCMKDIEIVAWVDRALVHQQIDHCIIESPIKVKEMRFDKILIAIKDKKIAQEIKHELEMYVETKKILWAEQNNTWEKQLIVWEE